MLELILIIVLWTINGLLSAFLICHYSKHSKRNDYYINLIGKSIWDIFITILSIVTIIHILLE